MIFPCVGQRTWTLVLICCCLNDNKSDHIRILFATCIICSYLRINWSEIGTVGEQSSNYYGYSTMECHWHLSLYFHKHTENFLLVNSVLRPKSAGLQFGVPNPGKEPCIHSWLGVLWNLMLFRCHFLGVSYVEHQENTGTAVQCHSFSGKSACGFYVEIHIDKFLVAWWVWLFKKKKIIFLFFFILKYFTPTYQLKQQRNVFHHHWPAINISPCPLSSLFTHISTCQITWVMGQSVSLIFGQMTLEAEPVSLGWSKDCKVIT